MNDNVEANILAHVLQNPFSYKFQLKKTLHTQPIIHFPLFPCFFLPLYQTMDVTDIFLLFVVSLSVAVFIILQNLEKKQQHDQTKTPRTDFSVVGAEKDLIFEEFSEDGSEKRAETGKDCGVSGNTGNMEDDYVILDDWEGIERTELEVLFGKAVVFVNNAGQIDDGDVILQLYGLQKVALEGPCHESQPMALKVSARSKWNAWQRLGNMSREMAMEKYVEILSMVVPDWRKVEGVEAVKEFSDTLTSTQDKDGIANETLIETMQRDIDPST